METGTGGTGLDQTAKEDKAHAGLEDAQRRLDGVQERLNTARRRLAAGEAEEEEYVDSLRRARDLGVCLSTVEEDGDKARRGDKLAGSSEAAEPSQDGGSVQGAESVDAVEEVFADCSDSFDLAEEVAGGLPLPVFSGQNAEAVSTEVDGHVEDSTAKPVQEAAKSASVQTAVETAGEEEAGTPEPAGWDEVHHLRSGSFVLETGSAGSVFKEVSSPEVSRVLGAESSFRIRSSVRSVSGGGVPSVEWPNQAWSAPTRTSARVVARAAATTGNLQLDMYTQ